MIRVQREDFNIAAELDRITKGRDDIGGIVTFTGLVRGEASGEKLTSMTLEHFPGMTERELERLEAEARSRWTLDDVLIVHRYGELKPGERIVLVATASRHREAAFAAASFLMDFLKTRAPFWKNEARAGGDKWVEHRASDDDAAARWK